MTRPLGRWLRYYALFRPLAQLPLPLAYRAAGLLGRSDYHRQAAVRTAIANSLRRVLPPPDETTLQHWLQNYFAMLARETLDVFTMAARTPANSRSLLRLRPGSLAVLRDAQRGGRGVIIAMAHYSRLNMLLLALALAGERLGMLTMVTDGRNPGLNALERRYLNDKIRTLLGFIGGSWITLGDDLRRLYTVLAAGETLVLLFDAFTPERPQKKLMAPFLGGELVVSRGIARLAERTGARVVYGVAHERDWRIEAELRPLPDQPEAALVTAVAELERDLRSAPWLWWHWNILELIWHAS